MSEVVPAKPIRPPSRPGPPSAAIIVPATIADPARRPRAASWSSSPPPSVRQFFAWNEHHQLGGLDDIEPLHIAAYVEQLQSNMAKPSVSSTSRPSACCSIGW
jgi:hypothetical protein